MQAQVNEIAGEVFAVRPFAGGVGDHQGGVVAFQQAHEVGVDERVVAHFHGMTQRFFAPGFEAGVAVQVRVVLTGEGGGRCSVVGQQGKKVFEAPGIEFEVRRKLPEDRPELVLELQHPGGEEIRQRLFDILEPAGMGDIARGLDREDEVVWWILLEVSTKNQFEFSFVLRCHQCR